MAMVTVKVYADALRTRRRLRAEAAVGKAGIKMPSPIVIFILPVLFVITLAPGMLSVLRDLKMLGAGR
jgi:tight adherence protein C